VRHSAPCRKYGVSPWGAFGEFSESVNLLIEGLAHEGALKKHDKFGQSNYQTAFGKILLWLKRQWACVAVLTAAESRYAALGYTGGNAQQKAAAGPMLRPNPRMTGGMTALTARFLWRKPLLPSLGVWRGLTPPPPPSFGNVW
jgi:hypothetical protein